MQPDPTLSIAVERQVTALLNQFQQQWQRDGSARIEEYLSRVDESARVQLLRDLLALERELRSDAGQDPRIDEYRERFPDQGPLVEQVFRQASATSLDGKMLASSDHATETESPEAPAGDAKDSPSPSGSRSRRSVAQEPGKLLQLLIERAAPALPNRPAAEDRAADADAAPTAKSSATLEGFVRSLTVCGLMDQAEIDRFVESLPAADRPRDGKQLAHLLYRRKRLTKFQVQAVYQGKTRGLVLGNYEVLDRIGRGGMGQVYKAQHRRMKRVVALKTLPWDASKSSHAISRFQREVEAASRLSHPNIVTAFDADEARGVHFLVMEYVDGEDLAALVKRSESLPVRTALDYLLQAARGLEYAHAHGVIHRDIKPANLLCDRQGTVKVLDMGLARFEQTVDVERGESLTHTGQVMGTLDYMAPEQALDTRLADARSDIYSLGCSLYYLLTGRHPYGGDTLAKKLLAHRNDPIPRIGARRSDGAGLVEAVFVAMVAKEPDERPQTMAEVIGLLEDCLAESPASAEPPIQSPAQRLVPPEPIEDWPDEDPLEEVQLDKTVNISQRLLVGSSRGDSRSRHAPDARSWYGDWLVIGASSAVLLCLLIFFSIVVLLRSDAGTLVVEVDQPGARVEVLDDGGRVVVRGIAEAEPLSFSVAPGDGRLRVEKEGFAFFAQDFTLERRGHALVTARLEPLTTAEDRLELAVDEPDALVEVLDGTGRIVSRYRTTGERLSIPLDEGEYRILVEKTGFEPFETSVTVDRDEERLVAVSLVADESSAKPVTAPAEAQGLLELVVDEPDASVELLDATGSIVFRHRTTDASLSIPLDEGEYRVLVEKTGFEPFETSLSVTPDGDHSLDVALVAMESQEDEPSEAVSQDVPLADGDAQPGAPAPAVAPFDSNQARAHQEAWAEYLGQPVEMTQLIGRGVELKAMLIPPGEFIMGSPESEEGRLTREGPQHRVRITRPFYLGVYPVTQAQWASVMGNNPSVFSSEGRLSNRVSGLSTAGFPVENVSWEDTQSFIDRLNERSEETGWIYRLPTEAEWEYACRAGTTTRYYFGDAAGDLGEYAWYVENSDGRPHRVGQKRPNAWGLHDILGNVWEWCSDWHGSGYYANSPLEDPTGPESGSIRVLRGGGWSRSARDSRSAFRPRFNPSGRYLILGFRVAFSPVE